MHGASSAQRGVQRPGHDGEADTVPHRDVHAMDIDRAHIKDQRTGDDGVSGLSMYLFMYCSLVYIFNYFSESF